MGLREYISESEAAALAGISTATLSRFAEAGYLHTEPDSDGIVLFAKDELLDLFGNSQDEDPDDDDTLVDLFEGDKIERPISLSAVIEKEIADEEPIRTYQFHKTSKARPKAFEMLESETKKLKNIVDMQEKILNLREKEIDSLSKERDWLRSRVEMQEEKSNRDQLILLQETQTLRKLVVAQLERKSPVRAALEWLGMVEPETKSSIQLGMGSTLDIEKNS